MNVMKKVFTVLLLCVFTVMLSAQSLFIDSETFMAGIEPGEPIEKGNYNLDGTTIQPNQWNCSNSSGNFAGTSPLAVVTPLQYPGYYTSTIPNAFKMETLASGGRSTVFSITSTKQYYTGSYYLAFMMKVESFPGTGTVGVVMFDGSHRADFRKTCLAIRKLTDQTFAFGIDMAESTVGTNTPVSGTYDIGTTYLVVMRHDFSNDKYYLYVNPAISLVEPTALVSGTNTASPLGNNGLRGITVKQRSQYSATLGGFRLVDNWEKALGLSGSSLDDLQTSKGNIISKEYYSLTGAKIERLNHSGIYLIKSHYENGEIEWSK